MMKPEPLAFYFDFVSPYAFIAWKQIHALAARHGREVAAKPVLFAGLLDHHGKKGPAEIPPKRVHTYKDACRKAHRAGIGALRLPPAHPFNPLTALRVASVPMSSDAQRRVVDVLFDAAWLEGTAIDTPAAVAAVLSRAGLDGDGLVRAASDASVKEQLREETRIAAERGVFGVPTVIADGEPFWGSESLDHVDAFLRGEDPVPKDVPWADWPTSAMRRALREGAG